MGQDLRSCLESLRRLRCETMNEPAADRRITDRRHYIPQLSLEKVITRGAIRGALRDAEIELYQLEEITEEISRDGVRIFAILVLTDQAAFITRIIEAGELHDQRLPFSLDLLHEQLSLPFAIDFNNKQWELIAPTFSHGTIDKLFNDKSILPFTKDEYIGSGAFGVVYQIELDHSHQQLDDQFRNDLVRKELENINDHKIELKNLSVLGHLRHPNILKLLSSYTYKGKHNLIFPLAKSGTLADLFAKDRHATSFRSDEVFIIALARLSSAIEQVHNFVERRINLNLIGCHHDLRPKNILISGESLLLADFGLSRFKALSESSATIFKQGAGDYLAPECEDLNRFQKLVVRRSSDIWSFGCILAEAVTYMVLGPDGVKRFQTKREFTKENWTFSLFHCGPGISNKAVNYWFADLTKLSTKPLERLLGLVRVMLSMDEEKRPKAKEVTTRLQLIAQEEVVMAIDGLLDNVVNQSSSLDALIEQKRFEAWKYAAGMLNRGNWLDSHYDHNQTRSPDFNATLTYLFQIQDELRSISAHENNVRGFVFNQLGRLNDCLSELLEGRLQEKYRAYLETSMIENEDEGFLEKIQDDNNGLSLDKKIRLRATLKLMTGLAMQHYETDTYKRQLDIKRISVGSPFGNHKLGLVQDGDLTLQVLIEKREYGRQCADETINHELFVRVEAITDLLSQEKPIEFRALDCRGFFHDPSEFAFGVVYNYPQRDRLEQDQLELRSLVGLITKTSSVVRLRPTLDDKFRLAYALARSVLEFHLVGWLHKRLNSSNIAFFATTEQLQDQWFQEPYIVGFNHSRPDEISAFTGEPEESSYQHPSYIKDSRRYCLQYDYYSLGIILLEVGLWQSLDQMTREYSGSYEYIRTKLLKNWIPLLKQSMGRSYFEAVRVCIEGDFGQSELRAGDANNAKALHLHFERHVVSQLNKFPV